MDSLPADIRSCVLNHATQSNADQAQSARVSRAFRSTVVFRRVRAASEAALRDALKLCGGACEELIVDFQCNPADLASHVQHLDVSRVRLIRLKPFFNQTIDERFRRTLFDAFPALRRVEIASGVRNPRPLRNIAYTGTITISCVGGTGETLDGGWGVIHMLVLEGTLDEGDADRLERALRAGLRIIHLHFCADFRSPDVLRRYVTAAAAGASHFIYELVNDDVKTAISHFAFGANSTVRKITTRFSPGVFTALEESCATPLQELCVWGRCDSDAVELAALRRLLADRVVRLRLFCFARPMATQAIPILGGARGLRALDLHDVTPIDLLGLLGFEDDCPALETAVLTIRRDARGLDLLGSRLARLSALSNVYVRYPVERGDDVEEDIVTFLDHMAASKSVKHVCVG